MTSCNTMKRLFKKPRKQFTGEWSAKTWEGTQIYGNYVWTDGTNIYYSNGRNQYVLNGNTWEAKTWHGLTDDYGRISFYAHYIWVDANGTIHYSSSDSQYVLNGDTWEAATDNSPDVVQYGTQVWTDGENIYYSYLQNHAIYIDGTWVAGGGTGLESETGIRGADIWTDGTNIYYSRSGVNYVRNNGTWEAKTWNISSLNGEYIWTDGRNTYYSLDTTQYVLRDGVWEVMTWNGATSVRGNYVWTDGTNVYYSYSSTSQLYLVPSAVQTVPFYHKENGAWVEKAMTSMYQKINGAWVEIYKEDLPAGLNYVYREG